MRHDLESPSVDYSQSLSGAKRAWGTDDRRTRSQGDTTEMPLMERNYTVHHFSRRLQIHHSSELSRSGSRSGGHLVSAWREAKFFAIDVAVVTRKLVV